MAIQLLLLLLLSLSPSLLQVVLLLRWAFGPAAGSSAAPPYALIDANTAAAAAGGVRVDVRTRRQEVLPPGIAAWHVWRTARSACMQKWWQQWQSSLATLAG